MYPLICTADGKSKKMITKSGLFHLVFVAYTCSLTLRVSLAGLGLKIRVFLKFQFLTICRPNFGNLVNRNLRTKKSIMSDPDCPVVEIKDGKLQGCVSKAEDPSAKHVYNYLNIPFGKPPTGKRRFMPPEKCDSWGGVRDATMTMKHPIQDAAMGRIYDDFLPMKDSLGAPYDRQEEECLNLNLFTSSLGNSSKLPVMVWIVGGGFMRASAGIYDGTALSGMNNVVVVSPNYRANALGFLSLGKDTKCPGNNGILDLILALEWVRDNVGSFGGDPQNVTIFGESAGGCLVELLMMSPLSRDLFHKAIAMSGNSTSPALFGDGEPISDLFLKGLEIYEKDPDKILEKLQSLSVDKITEVQKHYHGLAIFKPNLDGHVIRDTPENLKKAGQVAPIPFMTGVCDSEGGGLLCILSPPNFFTGCSQEDISPILQEVIRQQYPNANAYRSAELLVNAYDHVAENGDKYKYTKMYGQILADTVFNVSVVMSATAHSALQCPTYLYCMAKRVEFNHSDTNGPTLKNRPDHVNCDHGDTCHYLWGVPFIKGELPRGAWFTKEETEFSRVAMRYLTNFARTGNPNKGSDVPVEWPQYEPLTRHHLVMDEEMKVGENFGMQAVKLYTEDIPKMLINMSP